MAGPIMVPALKDAPLGSFRGFRDSGVERSAVPWTIL